MQISFHGKMISAGPLVKTHFQIPDGWRELDENPPPPGTMVTYEGRMIKAVSPEKGPNACTDEKNDSGHTPK